jgi:hypothetical protein
MSFYNRYVHPQYEEAKTYINLRSHRNKMVKAARKQHAEAGAAVSA